MELEAIYNGNTVTYRGRTMLRVAGGEAADATTSEETGANVETPEADASQTGEATPNFEAPFRLEDVPAEVRQHVEHYIAQTRPAVTEAFQNASQLRAEAQQALEMQESLESPDTAYDTLVELLQEHNLELSEEAWAAAQGSDDEAAATGERAPLDPELQEAIEFIRSEKAEKAENQSAEAQQHLNEHVSSHFSTLAEKHGYGESAEDVPLVVKEQIAAAAAVLPFDENGLPDLAGAQEKIDAFVAHEFQRLLNAKTPDDVPTGGTQGETRIDPKNPEDRLKLAAQVAERAMARVS